VTHGVRHKQISYWVPCCWKVSKEECCCLKGIICRPGRISVRRRKRTRRKWAM